MIYADALALVVSQKHRLAHRKTVSIVELASENFIAHNVVSPYREVEQEIEQKTLYEVRVKEMHVERKIRLVYPTRRALSHAARAFLELLG